MGKKRTRDGQLKPQGSNPATQRPSKQPRATADLKKTPPGAQRPVQFSTTSATTQSTEPNALNPSSLQQDQLEASAQALPPPNPAKPQPHPKRQKLAPLPPHVSITKRPIHHPPLPTPFSSSASPKTIYITHTSPFIPTIKRIRRLLSEISKRSQQSKASALPSQRNPRSKRSKPLEANGRLKAADVEREIVEGSTEEGGGVGEEEVFVRATGRAIERALQIGVHFQGESDCRVRVEMGSVQAIDDIEIKNERGGDGVAGKVDADADVGEGSGKMKGKKGETWKGEDIPETRIRTLSSITVAIGLK